MYILIYIYLFKYIYILIYLFMYPLIFISMPKNPHTHMLAVLKGRDT